MLSSVMSVGMSRCILRHEDVGWVDEDGTGDVGGRIREGREARVGLLEEVQLERLVRRVRGWETGV